MSDGKVHGRARATVVIEFAVKGSWGAECSIEQLHRQAKESAMDAVQQLFTPNAAVAPQGLGATARILKMSVEAVLVVRDD